MPLLEETIEVTSARKPVPLVRIPSEFYSREDLKASLFIIINLIIVLFSGVFAFYIGTWWAYLTAFVVAGARGQALYILQHECMHWLLFSNRKANDYVGVFISGVLGTRLYDGRAFHFKHHKEVGMLSDPNEFWHGTSDKKPGWSTVKFFIIQAICGRLFIVLNRALTLFKDATSQSKSSIIDLSAIFICQFTIFTVVSLLSSPFVYFVFYILPLITLTSLFESIRSFSEHILPGKKATCFAEQNRFYFMKSNFLERFFISQFSFNYHHVHHLYPNVVTFKLPKLHNWLLEHDPHYENRFITRNGYLDTLINYIVNKPIFGGGSLYPIT